MKTISVRLQDDVYNELSELAKLRGSSMNSIVSDLIRGTYHEIKKDPKVETALKQMNQLRELIESFSAEESVKS